MFKYPILSRVYVTHKIEFVTIINILKYRNNQQLSNILDNLVTNRAFLSHNKFIFNKEYSFDFFTNINSRITLPDTLKNSIQDELMWMDIDGENKQQY